MVCSSSAYRSHSLSCSSAFLLELKNRVSATAISGNRRVTLNRFRRSSVSSMMLASHWPTMPLSVRVVFPFPDRLIHTTPYCLGKASAAVDGGMVDSESVSSRMSSSIALHMRCGRETGSFPPHTEKVQRKRKISASSRRIRSYFDFAEDVAEKYTHVFGSSPLNG